MKKYSIIIATLSVALLLSACNTVSGFGQDVTKVGDKITEKSSR